MQQQNEYTGTRENGCEFEIGDNVGQADQCGMDTRSNDDQGTLSPEPAKSKIVPKAELDKWIRAI